MNKINFVATIWLHKVFIRDTFDTVIYTCIQVYVCMEKKTSKWTTQFKFGRYTASGLIGASNIYLLLRFSFSTKWELLTVSFIFLCYLNIKHIVKLVLDSWLFKFVFVCMYKAIVTITKLSWELIFATSFRYSKT